MSREDLEGGHRKARAPPSEKKKIAHKQKIQKRTINKIDQVEPTLKEMTYLMTIAETKKTFTAFQFFRKHY